MEKRIAAAAICALLIGMLTLGGPVHAAKTGGQDASAEGALRISATVNTSAEPVTIPLTQGNYEEFYYHELTDVTIEIDGTAMPLEDALQGGYITVEEIVARAKLDAAQEICTETSETKDGLPDFWMISPVE